MLPTLSIRRGLLCKTFFMQVSKPEHNLNYLFEKINGHPYDLTSRHNQKYKIDTLGHVLNDIKTVS